MVSGPASTAPSPSAAAVADLVERPRARVGVDRQPLPGDAAEHERRAERLAEPRDRQRADDVAAAADPEDERALGARTTRHESRRTRRGGRLSCVQAGTGSACAADRADLGGGAVELLVGHHRGALEGQVAVDLDPGAAAVVLVADAHGHRARDPVHPQQQHVQRMARASSAGACCA